MTSFAYFGLTLLAAREELHRVWGRFDHEQPGINPNHLIFIAAVILMAIVAGVIWRTVKRRAARTFASDSTGKLFRELCAAHGIGRAGRRLLKELAAASGDVDPATLFVEPRYFEAQNLPRALKASAKELRLLDETLFG
jgi:hypothetical protein